MDIWNSACPDDTLSETWINATLSPSQEFAIKQDEGKEKQTAEQIVQNTMNIWTSSRKNLNTSLNHDHGITQST